MRKQGTIVRWDEAKGFGFIQSPESNAQLFVHIRDWHSDVPPAVNVRVSFEEIHVWGKGPRAMDVRPANARAVAPQPSQRAGARRAPPANGRSQPHRFSRRAMPSRQETPALPALALMCLWVGLLVAGAVLGRWPWILLLAAFLLNIATFFVYWQDKFAATKGAWRTAENTLHLFGLIGGWPGAWFAHQILRHKSSKQAFRNVYWMTAILNLIALGVWVVLPWLPLAR